MTERKTLAKPRHSAGTCFRGLFRAIIATIVLLTVVTVHDCAEAQEYREGVGVELNDRVPREVREVTVVQNLGETIPQDLPLTDWLGPSALATGRD